MHKDDIKVDQTYLFIGTHSEKRKHLIGEAFTVVEIKRVHRKMRYRKGMRTVKVTRFFNEDGIGAAADELGELPERDFPCEDCDFGEMKQVGFVQPNGQVNYECDKCGFTQSFP